MVEFNLPDSTTVNQLIYPAAQAINFTQTNFEVNQSRFLVLHYEMVFQ